MKNNRVALLAVAMGNVIFGFSFLFSKIALEVTIPTVLIAIRFVTAFIVLNILVLVGRTLKKQDGSNLIEFSLKGKPVKEVLLLALFQPVIYFFCETYGIAYTSSAFSGTMIAVIPMMSIVFDVIIMKTKVSKRQIACAGLSLVGVAITTVGASEMSTSMIGFLFLVGAVTAASLFYILSRKSGAYYNPFERTYVMFAVGSISYLIIAGIQCFGQYEEYVLGALAEPKFLIAVCYLAVLSSVVAFTLLNYGASKVPVSQASIFANLTTVISIVAGVVILKESFTIQQVIGATIIIGSVYVSSTENAST